MDVCTAVAGPVRWENFSVHVSLVPVMSPVNEPDAFVFLTTCFGTSCFAVSFAAIMIGLALRVAPANAVTASAASVPARTGGVTELPHDSSSVDSRRFAGSS